MSDLDLARRIELERADAERSAIERAIKKLIDISEKYRSESYRKAWKAAIDCLRRE